jgi:hypothetical protein
MGKQKSAPRYVRPRNLHVAAIRRRGGSGVHEKPGKALRAAAKVSLKKLVPSDRPSRVVAASAIRQVSACGVAR